VASFGVGVISAKTAIDSATAAEAATKVGFRADFLAFPLMRWKMLMHENSETRLQR
jgi:hypothetical protein